MKEDARYLKATTTQRSNEVETLRGEVNEFLLQEVQQRKFLDDQSHNVLTVICSGDRSRRSSAQLAYDEEQQAISVCQIGFTLLITCPFCVPNYTI